MTMDVLGIDISKAKFDVALCKNKKLKFKKFNNSLRGFQDLDLWLKKAQVSDLHACMEATGNYGEALALHLHDTGIKVSVVNPARIKGYAQCELSRTKTDKADSQLIARFCQAIKPDFWQPKPLHIRQLQQWVRRVDALQRMRRQECNRKGSSSNEDVVHSIETIIAFLDEQIIHAKAAIERIIVEHSDLQRKRLLVSLTTIMGASSLHQKRDNKI